MNLKCEDNISVSEFINRYYDQCLVSAFNVVRKRFKDDVEQKACELRNTCLCKLLHMKSVINPGKVYHQLLINEITFDYSNRNGNSESIHKFKQQFEDLPIQEFEEQPSKDSMLDEYFTYDDKKKKQLQIVHRARQTFSLDEELLFEKIYIDGYKWIEIEKYYGVSKYFINKINKQILKKINIASNN